MELDKQLIEGLPDAASAMRFFDELVEKHPAHSSRLSGQRALLSDVLTLAAFSPLLATTLLRSPDHLEWLGRKRRGSGVCSTEELLESLARFSLTNSQLKPHALFARFRRRELLRIFLRDIRGLATIAEITEEISNLADSILESALKIAQSEIDGRYGQPRWTDGKGRTRPARFCIAALGKLGSRELNYSSDIDLVFLYSDEGQTSGSGARGVVTNREYFIKLAEHIVKLVGEAYRVDLRLRPHGSLGALAISAEDTTRYYRTDARPWEHQVMIRSRGAAGDVQLFREIFAGIEDLVFSVEASVASALANVRLSKEQIDREQQIRGGYNVKLGRGGIREIEFIAQALQLAHGGRDRWLRFPHTLVSLDRLADRALLAEGELTGLAAAYEFLRRTEHILQMENGLQTHSVPDEPEKRGLVIRRVEFALRCSFEKDLKRHTDLVRSVFERVFGPAEEEGVKGREGEDERSPKVAASISRTFALSPHFTAVLAAHPDLEARVRKTGLPKRNYREEIMSAVGDRAKGLGERLSALRRTWSGLLLEVVFADHLGLLTLASAKQAQTELAEASIAAALDIAGDEGGVAVLALGKLGGGGVDYESDLDLIFVYNADFKTSESDGSGTLAFGRVVEGFVNALSSMTRDGSLYRVDLRLRPYGSKGLSAMSATAFLEYMRETAVAWEMLAFVKLRAVGGDLELGKKVESETRRIIHERALAIDPVELAAETRRVRLALQHQRAKGRRGKDIDIKYGEGGMLDVYFATRYLQLVHNVPDEAHDRSTTATLHRLAAFQFSTLNSHYSTLADGYAFLSALDHGLRLTVGRTTRVPLANAAALAAIATRMNLSSASELLEHLTMHRLAIREAFDAIVPSQPA